MIDNARQKSSLLRKALMSNAAFSGLTGSLLTITAPWLSQRMGIPEPMILRAVGVSLLGFAAALLWNATRHQIDRKQAWAAVGLDVTWVLGSVVLLSLQLMTASGN